MPRANTPEKDELIAASALIELRNSPKGEDDPVPANCDEQRNNPNDISVAGSVATEDQDSADKRVVKEQKLLLSRQERQVKHAVAKCMDTIKKMHIDQMPGRYRNAEPKAGPSGINDAQQRDMRDDTGYTTPTSSESDVEEVNVVPESIKKIRSCVRYEPNNSRAGPAANIPNGASCAQQSRRPLVSHNHNTPSGSSRGDLKVTKVDQSTQTDPQKGEVALSKILQLENGLQSLFIQVQSFIQRAQLQQIQQMHEQQRQARAMSMDMSEQQDSASERDETLNLQSIEEDGEAMNDNDEVEENDNPIEETPHVRRVAAHTTNAEPSHSANDDMVAIGDGHASVPATVFNEIDWDSPTTATRQLLQAIFPRRVLATHSLSGQRSPAFAHRPAKQRLDPRIISDIVKIVSMRCGVSKSTVRSYISVKCTDEAKLYRNRLRSAARRAGNNAPISPQESNESSNEE